MASKRHIRRKQCGGKVRHADQTAGVKISIPGEEGREIEFVPVQILRGMACGALNILSKGRMVMDNEPTAADAVNAAQPTDQQAIAMIDRICGDEFCEELDIKEAFHPEEVTGGLRIAHEKLSQCYRIAHSMNRGNCCFHVHDDWRKSIIGEKKPTADDGILTT